uniref:Uncharacterized protein n=1 Tax=Anguilla anguilla TaxID=7936 RepID=A0A0E9XKI4_ANGAN
MHMHFQQLLTFRTKQTKKNFSWKLQLILNYSPTLPTSIGLHGSKVLIHQPLLYKITR